MTGVNITEEDDAVVNPHSSLQHVVHVIAFAILICNLNPLPASLLLYPLFLIQQLILLDVY